MQLVPARQAVLADLEKIVPLFDGYRQFYGQPSDEAAVRGFLRKRFEQRDSVLFVAEVEGRAVGFTQLYPTFSSVSMARTFVLNDLFTDKPFNRLKASIAPLIGHHPCAKIFVILTTA